MGVFEILFIKIIFPLILVGAAIWKIYEGYIDWTNGVATLKIRGIDEFWVKRSESPVSYWFIVIFNLCFIALAPMCAHYLIFNH